MTPAITPLPATRPSLPASRREFLATTLSGLGALLLGSGSGCDSPSDGGPAFDPGLTRDDLAPTEVPLSELLAAWFGDADRSDVDAVGQAWTGGLADDDALLAALQPVVASVGDASDVTEAAARWDAAIAADFDATAGVVALHGWQLSTTEAALCALMALFGPASDGAAAGAAG